MHSIIEGGCFEAKEGRGGKSQRSYGVSDWKVSVFRQRDVGFCSVEKKWRSLIWVDLKCITRPKSIKSEMKEKLQPTPHKYKGSCPACSSAPSLKKSSLTPLGSSTTGYKLRQHFLSCYPLLASLTGGSVVKNLPANAGDVRDTSSVPGSGRSPGEGSGNPLQYSCQKIPWTEESGRQSGSSWGHKKSTEWLSMHSCNPLLYILCWNARSTSVCGWPVTTYGVPGLYTAPRQDVI